jgi:tetratricopeptide (TPR) repeat protein
MRIIRLHIIISALAVLLYSCSASHQDFLKELEVLKANKEEVYPVVYALSAYLSTTSDITSEEAIPLILELISLKYYTEARLCIDNLETNGIHSPDLKALRGLCYFNELQPELAEAEIAGALKKDPDNEKIQTLLVQISGGNPESPDATDLLERAADLVRSKDFAQAVPLLQSVLTEDPAQHQALYLMGMAKMNIADLDSAQYFIQFARSSERLPEYDQALKAIDQWIQGDELINANPASYSGYLTKSQGLAALAMFDRAQETLTAGLQRNPENMNLILAKALVWVQAGEKEKAEQYLRDLEQMGLALDPSLKQRILQNEVSQN